MIEFLQLPEALRRQIIEQVSARADMSVKSIEKDWWVTLVLKALFSLPMRQHFVFKGGTSLSKAWKLIERFSEDVDIALAPEAFGRKYERTPSHSYVKALKKEGCAYTSTVIKNALGEQLANMGIPPGMITLELEEVDPKMPDKDPQTLFVRYPSLYEPNPYIADIVKLEFGVRSLKEPFADVAIQSIIAEVFPTPSYTEKPFTVAAVEPRKTFMEKLFLLHEKFSTERENIIIAERQSRHLSDLVRMTNLGIAQQAFDDQNLYSTLLQHRCHYVRLKNVNYESMSMTNLWIIPPPIVMEQYRRDYEAMRREMLYSTSPDFDTLVDQLRELNGNLVTYGHGESLVEVIEQARNKIQNQEGNEILVEVEFETDPTQAADTTYSTRRYLVEFIRRGDAIIFHRVRILK